MGKYILLILTMIVGYSYSFYYFSKRMDYSKNFVEIEADIIDKTFFVEETKRLRNESVLKNAKTGEQLKAFMDREDVLKIISLDTLNKLTKSNYSIYTDINQLTVNKNVVRNNMDIKIGTDSLLSLSIGSIQLSPKILLKTKTNNGYSYFIPSLREVDGIDSMLMFFDENIHMNSEYKILTDTNYRINESFDYDAFSVERVIDKNGNEIYFFPYNPIYEDNKTKAIIYFVLTTLLVLLILLSIIFNWKIYNH
jgi:hypothetical protein